MRDVFSRLFCMPALGVLISIFAGCASSPPSKFYTLTSVESTGPLRTMQAAADGILVAIGPITIPAYLDRPQIVTRSGRNNMEVNEFDRWSGPLENDISRVLVENLSSLLGADHFYVVRWAPASQTHVAIDYRVAVDVIRFDASPGGAVHLKAQWTILDEKTENLPLMRESTFTETAGGPSYAAMVEAMSRAIGGLSRDISETIRTLDAGKKEKES